MSHPGSKPQERLYSPLLLLSEESGPQVSPRRSGQSRTLGWRDTGAGRGHDSPGEGIG